MRSRRALIPLVATFIFAVPAQAYAADTSAVVPDWLAMVVAGVGLLTATILVVDAVLLRRVAEGSVVAQNIQYMILATVLFAMSTLGRWALTQIDDAITYVQVSFTADLLVIAGMALLAVYFYRIRRQLTEYLQVLSAPTTSEPSAKSTSESTAGEDVDA